MRLRARLLLTTLAVSAPVVAALYLLDARARHDAAERLLSQGALHHMRAPGERARCEAAPETWGGAPLAPPDPPDHGPPGDGASHMSEPPGHGLRGDDSKHTIEKTGHLAPGDGSLHRTAPPGHGPPGDGAIHMPEPPGHGPPGPPPDARSRGGAPPILFAYASDLRSANPNAPAIDRRLAAAIADADLATLDPLWPGSEVLVLVRAPWDEGPCARILARGTTTPGWFGALLPADPLWLLPVFAVLFGVALAAGPAVRRIQRLAARVRRSAEGGFSEPVALPGDDEIAELSRAFDRAATTVRDQLRENQRREQALREFVANTTHDVMTPLTVLADHLTTLRERAESGGGADLATVAAATAEVQYLGAIIENLGLAAKLDASAPTCARAPVELDALVDRVVSRHQTFARARDVALAGATLETPARTLADVTMLEQALSNLVHNAIRYNAPGGHVAVLLERPAPGRARLRVIDDGPGIPDEAIARLLQRGARSDEARTREPGGQGLGLSIALRVAALHNMTLELGRSEHGGLRVDLTGDELEPRRA